MPKTSKIERLISINHTNWFAFIKIKSTGQLIDTMKNQMSKRVPLNHHRRQTQSHTAFLFQTHFQGQIEQGWGRGHGRQPRSQALT